MVDLLKVNKLSKQYGNYQALKPLDFVLKSGEICAVIGKNGAGKSTFFKMLSGQIKPTTGEIILFPNNDLMNISRGRKKIGFMIEEPTFFPNLNAYQNLNYFRIQRGISEKQRINEVLEIVGINQYPKKKFKQYSMGMKQRLGLALALLSGPDILVLDEPTNGLDAEGITEIRRLLIKLNREKEITILVSSHILAELQLIATRYLFIEKGNVVENISSKEFKERSEQHLKIKVDNISKAVNILESNFEGINFKVYPDNELRIYGDDIDKNQINRVLLNQDIQISELRVESINLEEYFLGLGGHVND
ncbi:ABC transporter ATP-binding protein [Macrococcus animalis]|uniref:ABC transporter ATP-binding protein n=1 Tax=Macrococcus animalis TaxID=3395467 RepID=UPI0039BE87A4